MGFRWRVLYFRLLSLNYWYFNGNWKLYFSYFFLLLLILPAVFSLQFSPITYTVLRINVGVVRWWDKTKRNCFEKKELLVYAKFAVETANRYYYSICTLYAEPWCFLPVVLMPWKAKPRGLGMVEVVVLFQIFKNWEKSTFFFFFVKIIHTWKKHILQVN